MADSDSTLPVDKHNDNAERVDAKSSSSDQTVSPTHDAEKAARAEPGPPRTAPDGGAVAWLVVLGCWCTSFCSFGWLNSVGVFQEYYQNELLTSYSTSAVSWIPSLEIFFMMAMGPIVGALYDRYGPRWLLLTGSVMHVFGIMMTSISDEYYQILLAQGLCSALGVSMIFQPTLACAAGWFDRRRGAAFGVLFTGSSIGGIVLPILVTHLIRDVGFGWAMRTCAFVMLGLLIIANLTVRPLNPPQPRKVTRAELMKPMQETQFQLLMIGMFLFTYGFYAPINYLPAQAVSAGMSPNLVQYLVPILNAGSLFGRLFAGFVGDKIGRYNVFISVCYLSGIFTLALWLPDSRNAALIAFAVLFGFFSGAYVSLLTPLIMQISPMAELGFRTGMMLLVMAIGGLTTNPINGAIVDSPSGWAGLKIFSGILALVGTTFVLIARVKKTGWKLLVRY
ncbi:MCT family MFS transporter [Aspergillus lucknowensis]|uniref:Major facilitator superfamily domain-containing protein n=1 Tax=Aspergillus lucknowensis TaxID=176173 RepID=A0ABR4LJU6_9EURO